jgi:hypothetical protein
MVYLLTQIPANLVIWYIFPPFWYVVPRKSGNPHLWSSIIVSKTYSIKHTFWQNTTTSNWRIWRREIWRIYGRFVLTCPIEKLVAAWGTKKLADDQGDQGPML